MLRQRIETTLSPDTNVRRQAELDLRRVSTAYLELFLYHFRTLIVPSDRPKKTLVSLMHWLASSKLSGKPVSTKLVCAFARFTTAKLISSCSCRVPQEQNYQGVEPV